MFVYIFIIININPRKLTLLDKDKSQTYQSNA